MRPSRIVATSAATLGGVVAASPFVVRGAMRQPRGETFDSGSATLHYSDQGNGTPLVLLHGFAVNGDLNWRLPGLVKKLSQDYRLIVLDQRGHGASGAADTYGTAMVDDVVALLDHLGIDKAHVAGYSLGGVITLKLATLHPERLISASTLGSGWERPDNSMFLGAIEEIATELETGKGVGPLSQHLGDDRAAPGLIHRSWVMFMTSFANDGVALAGVVRGIPDLTVDEDDLRTLSVPLCAIAGSEAPMAVGAEALRGRVPNVEVTIIDGADHISATSHAELFATFSDFLKRHS